MPKFLDNNGLTRLWTKLKEYLASWKTTNFGTGTYDNKGSISISEQSKISLSSSSFEVISGGGSGVGTITFNSPTGCVIYTRKTSSNKDFVLFNRTGATVEVYVLNMGAGNFEKVTLEDYTTKGFNLGTSCYGYLIVWTTTT